jgi:hypothetical protein
VATEEKKENIPAEIKKEVPNAEKRDLNDPATKVTKEEAEEIKQ